MISLARSSMPDFLLIISAAEEVDMMVKERREIGRSVCRANVLVELSRVFFNIERCVMVRDGKHTMGHMPSQKGLGLGQ